MRGAGGASSEPLRDRLGVGTGDSGHLRGNDPAGARWWAGPDQHSLGRVDITVRRNGYGTQIESFEASVDVSGLESPFHAVFIRAPVVERVGSDVEVLARMQGRPVLCSSGPVTVAAFHPELSGDDRIHAGFLAALA